MKPEQRDRILIAIDKASIRLNGIDLQTSMATATRMFSGLAALTARMQTREQIIEIFNSFPDASLSEELMITAVCQYLPQLLRIGGTALAEMAKKESPRLPGGGRPLALRAEEVGQVCKYIGGLLPDTSYANAILRASQKFNVSERTIERVWSERLEPRDEALEPTFPEVLNAVKGFVADLESDNPTTELKSQDQLNDNPGT